MSAYVFTAVAGGSLGLLAGGVLTQLLSWHWIFFVNLPIGVVAIVAGRAADPRATRGARHRQGVDWLGSVLVTLAIGIAVYAIVEATTHGWGSAQVIGGGALAVALLGAFFALEARIENPIMPLRILRLPRPGRLVHHPRLPGHRHVRHLVPREPVPRARPALRRDPHRSRIHAMDADGRRPLDGHHASAGGPPRRAAR